MAAEDADMTEVPMAVEVEVTPITGMITMSAALAVVKGKETFNIIKGVDEITHIEVDEDSGMEMTRITVTETTGIETLMVKVILTGVENGIIITEAKDTVIMEEGRRWNPNQQYHDPGYQQESEFPNPNHYHPPPMGHQYRYPISYDQYSDPPQPQQYQSQRPTPSQQATNICQLCHSQGHYDYQCQFAGDLMACTQKAFNQG